MYSKLIFFSIISGFFILSSEAFSQSYIPPEPLGGQHALKKLWLQEMYFPAGVRNQNIEIEMTIMFTVDAHGKPQEIRALPVVDTSIMNEALRLFHLIEWKPGRINGKTQASHYEIKIPFHIKKYFKYIKKRGYDKPDYPFQPCEMGKEIYEPKKLTKSPEPRFHDGSGSIREYLIKNLRYPNEALKRDIQGTVELRFVIEPSGRITNLHIIKSLGAGCDEEALRLIEKLMWVPGQHHAQYVRSWMSISITFALGADGGYRYHPVNQSGNIH